jgi:hypothetical protein
MDLFLLVSLSLLGLGFLAARKNEVYDQFPRFLLDRLV